ncbi:MAG TPA: NAD(P)/FAD-dependent oxidoreductase [Rubricoccaceae bacterium]
MSPDVAIVGAGLAGLACARQLAQSGISCTVFEASDGVGGRVRTDVVDGFRIDRGFQVFLMAYPEARAVLDYDALDLRAFEPGALVRLNGRWERVGDPFRDVKSLLPTLVSRVGTLGDKVRVLGLREAVRRGTTQSLWARPETTTLAALRERYGFSARMTDRFFRPFLGGVLLDGDLGASSRAFEFYFRMFSEGDAAVPAQGIGAIPDQLADRLPAGSIQLNAPVAYVEADGSGLRLASGETVACRVVVVATDAAAVPGLVPGTPVPAWKGTVQIAYAAPRAPKAGAVLMLDGDAAGPVNNAQTMSNVAAELAPRGQALVTASVLGTPAEDDVALDAAARVQMRAWFGPDVDVWRTLAVHRIPHALPDLPSLDPPERPLHVRDGLFLTGDWLRNGSIDGALVAGRHAAEAVTEQLRADSPLPR